MVAIILYALATIWLSYMAYRATQRPRPCRPRAPYVLVVTETGHLRRIWLSDYTHKDVVRLVRVIEDSNKLDDGDGNRTA